MRPTLERLAVTALAGGAALVLAAAAPAQPPAQPPGQAPAPGPGQFRYVPQQFSSQPTAQPAGVSSVASPGTGYVPAPAAPPYPYGPYWPYYPYVNPYGGGLEGAADAISAQGQFEKDFQQARLTAQEVERSKIDTRRKQWEEWLYEREHRPTVEDERERMRQEQLRRARNNPPSAEVWSGEALNLLLTQVQKEQPPGFAGPTVPLDPSVLAHINLTSGATGGDVGVFKDGGKLEWPLPLRSAEFADERQRADALAGKLVQQARQGAPDPDTLQALQDLVDKMKAHVKSLIETMPPSDNIKAKRFLNDLADGLRGLQDPNVAKYFNGSWKAQGDTVSQLVAQMTQQGLTFAPAQPGDEAAYTALHTALVAYDRGLSTLIAKAPR